MGSQPGLRAKSSHQLKAAQLRDVRECGKRHALVPMRLEVPGGTAHRGVLAAALRGPRRIGTQMGAQAVNCVEHGLVHCQPGRLVRKCAVCPKQHLAQCNIAEHGPARRARRGLVLLSDAANSCGSRYSTLYCHLSGNSCHSGVDGLGFEHE